MLAACVYQLTLGRAHLPAAAALWGVSVLALLSAALGLAQLRERP